MVLGWSLLLFGNPRAQAIIDAALQMQLGNPSGATVDTNNHDHYLIQRSIEALDYSDHLGQANWVSWDLTADDIGSSGRTDAWAEDTSLPDSFYKVPTSTFGSGYDRGHMCPSGDRTASVAVNELTFIMSNIIPQASLQNQNIWANFENYCRQTLLPGGKELLIICGPSLFTTNKVDSGHVAVAGYTWKIVVVVPGGAGAATNRISATTQVIALRMPNTDAVAYDPWQNYRTNVVAIEADTGFTFFTALSSNLATVLRNKIDGQAVPAPAITGFSPGSGPVSSSVVITGTNFVFATNVTFNGTSAAFNIDSTQQITATVPAGATAGPIRVMTLGGTATSAGNFTPGGGAAADLAVSLTHAGNFTQGDVGVSCTIVVTNGSTGASSGTVTVTDTLPSGLTATSIGGSGWTANLGTLTCTRSDSLAAGAAYPPITVTVNVSASAAATVTNAATVSGGGDTTPANNTASDPTVVNPAAAPAVVTDVASGVGATAATLNATVNPNGQPATVRFEYGTNTSYGSVALVPGTLAGTVAQPVGANVANLLPATTYHFRASATNLLGAADGLDETFTTAPAGVPDLAIAVSHPGSFTQGATGVAYTINVQNVGTAASAGMVTVVDALPAGLTATGISGSGWTADLGTLTCTRSDTLPAGTAYPAITLTVDVAANAASPVTNTAAVSGGGDTNPANNNASDPTVIEPVESGGNVVTLVGWDVNGLPGGTDNFGPSPLAPATNDSRLVVEGLTRGSGVGTTGTGAQRAWGGNLWTNTSAASAVSSNRFATFAVAASDGYTVSFASLSRFCYRRSATGPGSGLLQYRIGSGVFNDIATVSYSSNTASGGALPAIDLSGIAPLQNVGAGTNVTFRIVNWGGTSSAGTWYIFDVTNSTALDFMVEGTVSPVVVPAADLAVTLTHAGTFTQGDAGDTYTITVTNRGNAATAGSVSVVDTLPSGLMAVAMGGTGWSADLGTLTCTRSDGLAPGAIYPPITLTVSVATNAPATVTNLVAVSGGGETETGNNSAVDSTTIIPLEPVQLWRLYWYGTTADSGAAADATIAPCGMPNLVAYALGLDPTVPGSNPVVADVDTGYLRLTVPRNPDATDVTFFVEIASNLAAGPWTTSGTTVDIDTPSLLQVHADAPVASSAVGYIRLRVSRP